MDRARLASSPVPVPFYDNCRLPRATSSPVAPCSANAVPRAASDACNDFYGALPVDGMLDLPRAPKCLLTAQVNTRADTCCGAKLTRRHGGPLSYAGYPQWRSVAATSYDANLEPWSASMTKPCPGPLAPTKPRLVLPHGACDTHVHVLGPYEKYPLNPARTYTAP